MKLELGLIHIKDVQFGAQTEVKNGTLFVDKDAIIRLAKEDERIKDVTVELARPGEEVRIIPVKDVIEPRVKVSGSNGNVYPGMLGKVETVGEGRTNVLKGGRDRYHW
jgi:glycine reductase